MVKTMWASGIFISTHMRRMCATIYHWLGIFYLSKINFGRKSFVLRNKSVCEVYKIVHGISEGKHG